MDIVYRIDRTRLGTGPGGRECAADRGYDDTENRYCLQQHGIQNAMHVNRFPIHKKGRNREVWVALTAEP